MTFSRLLAKSSANPDQPQPSETLSGHTTTVLTAANALLETVGDSTLTALGLEHSYSFDTLRATLLRAAVLHDLGKANSQFQQLIRHQRSAQALRHEFISVWLLFQSHALDSWLFAGCPDDIRLSALFAVLGHHLKVTGGESIEVQHAPPGKLEVYCQHEDFVTCLHQASDLLGISAPPALSTLRLDYLHDERPLEQLRDWLIHGAPDPAGHEQRRFVAVVKALLVAADAAGSAIPRKKMQPDSWIIEMLARTCSESDLRGIVNTGIQPRAFQLSVARSSERVTFVKAGCGTGKTIAAYLWAAEHAAGRKLFFCYPTTGTASEGFRDYLITTDMATAGRLIHSRSAVDIERMLPADVDDSVTLAAKFESLASWDAQIIVCTADTVLGLIQNNYRPLCAFPALVNAAFVFDEVHQYDDRLFGALLRFLDAFRGVPVLLMTASLPSSRLTAIEQTLADTGCRLEVIAGPREFETLPRYELSRLQSAEPWNEVMATLAQGGKVIWITNTVPRAVRFWQMAAEYHPLLYHSRFRYSDRLDKHTAVIQAFKDCNRQPAFAITTQVCEVSLDISADLLITDLAPIPALIQRLGRLNRRAQPGQPTAVKKAIVLEPQNELPYDRHEFEGAREWLNLLAGRPLSQSDLAEAFERFAPNHPSAAVESAWLDGWVRSYQASLRSLDSNITVIRGEDRQQCLNDAGMPNLKEIIRHSLPMPLGQVADEVGGWERLGPALVAPVGRIVYSEETGGIWAE